MEQSKDCSIFSLYGGTYEQIQRNFTYCTKEYFALSPLTFIFANAIIVLANTVIGGIQ